MIKQFQTKPVPRIIFGPGEIARLPEIIKEKGESPLFILSPTFAQSPDWHALQAKISLTITPPLHMEEISGEPSPEIIDDIVGRWKKINIDMVIAIGGGSVLDGGKAISAMLCEKDGVENYLEGVGSRTPTGNKIFFIAIPTTSGTGSEATSNAVLAKRGENGFKKSLRHDNYIPNIALVDPALTLSCPVGLTTACGMDTFSQLVEGYLSTNGSAVSDSIALEGIGAISRSLEKVYANGADLGARTDLAYASLCSGIVLTNAGLGTVHGFASTIGGLFPIPHGVVCGTLMAHANRLTLLRLRRTGENPKALDKYARLGLLFGCEEEKENKQQDAFIEELIRLSSLFEIPPLSDYTITREDIPHIINLSGNKYNPAQLDHEELTEMLESRIE